MPCDGLLTVILTDHGGVPVRSRSPGVATLGGVPRDATKQGVAVVPVPTRASQRRCRGKRWSASCRAARLLLFLATSLSLPLLAATGLLLHLQCEPLPADPDPHHRDSTFSVEVIHQYYYPDLFFHSNPL